MSKFINVLIDINPENFKHKLQEMHNANAQVPSWVRTMREINKTSLDNEEHVTRTGALCPWGGTGKNRP